MRPFTLMDIDLHIYQLMKSCEMDREAHRTVMLSSQVAERRDQFRAYYEIDQQARDSARTLVLQLTHGLATIESVYTIIEMVCKMWEDEEQRAGNGTECHRHSQPRLLQCKTGRPR